MKIPEMAWITQINYIVVVECLLYLFYHSKRLYLSYRDSNAFVHIGDFLELHEFRYFCDWTCGFFCARARSGVQYEWKRHHVFSANGQSNY